MSSTSKSAAAVAFGIAALCVAGSASAGPFLTVSGSGLWSAAAPVTAYSAPSESYAFSFRIPAVYSTIYSDATVSVTTDFSQYSYSLNGSPVAGLPDDIAFFSAALNGGFALAYPLHSIEFIGPDIGSQGVLTPGHYTFYPNVDYVTSGGLPVNQGDGPTLAAVVPEPTAWALMLVGFGGVGGLVRRGRRRLLAA